MSVLGGLLGRRGKPARRSGEDLLVTVLIVLVGVLLAVTFVYWVTGQVAGRVFGGAWPEVTFASMPGVLTEALRDPGDPAAAWPAAAQALLPGPVGFYVVMAALCLLPAGAAVAVLHLVLRPGRAPKPAETPARRRRRRAFASRRVLRPLLVGAPRPGRVTLGRAAGRLLAAEPGQSVAVVGPPRSLKTAGLVLPAILEWHGPVVVACTSGRLVLDSLERRQELGTVRVFDPAGTLGGEVARVGWSPLHQAGTWSGAQRAARSLTAAELATRSPGLPPAAAELPALPGVPAAAVTDLLAASLLAAGSTGRTVAEALGWLETGERDDLERALDAAGVRVATVTFGELWQQEEAQRERVYARAARILAPWAGAAARPGAVAEQLDPEGWLLDGGAHTVYLTAPEDELPQFRPLLATVLQEIVAAVQARDGGGARLAPGPSGGPPLLLVLDDAADVGALRTLDVLTAGAGRGIQVVSTFRSLADLRARYGERAHAVLNGHRARVVLSGTTDPETLDYVANLAGDAAIRARGPVRPERRVTPAGVLRTLRPGVGLLLYGSLPPVELSLRPWSKERSVRALVGARRLAAYDRSRTRGPAGREATR